MKFFKFKLKLGMLRHDEGAQVVRYIDLPSALRVEILARDNI